MAATTPFSKNGLSGCFAAVLRTLAFERFQKLKNLAQHGFGMALDFFNQKFLRTHIRKLNDNFPIGKII